MPNPKLETYKNKATGTVYDYTDAAAQAALAGILDGTDIDSFSDVESALADKVDKVTGKGLSTNDYDDTEKAKVAGAFPRSEQAVLGAKNLLPLTLASLKASTSGGSWADNVYTNGGVAYTISTNSAGYVTEISASGTADGSDSYFRITTKLADYLTVGEKYTLNGCPSDGGISKYCIYTGSAGVWEDDGNGVDKEYVNTITNLFIKVNHDVTVNNLKFYPMIRLATDPDPTYARYAMTNEQLTKLGLVYRGAIPSGADLDNYVEFGAYDINGTAPTNFPSGSSGYVPMLVFPRWGHGNIKQIIISRNNEIYLRNKNDGESWSSWYKFAGTVVS